MSAIVSEAHCRIYQSRITFNSPHCLPAQPVVFFISIMAKSRQQKEETLAKLEQQFEKAKSVVFAQYRGLSVKDMTELRKKLRANNVQLHVAKKTLIKMAAKNKGQKEIPNEDLDGPVVAAFSMGDEMLGAKTLYEFSKTHSAIKLICAIMEGAILSKEKTLEVAKLPSKEELIAKFVGSLKAPISGFYGVLHNVLSGFVRVVSAYKGQKETA